MADTGPLPERGAQPSRRAMGRNVVSLRTVAALAIAAALVIAVLGVGLLRKDGAPNPKAPTSLSDAAHLALTNPAAKQAQLRAADGTVNARAVVLPDGTGFVLAEALPPLGKDRTYQLWGLSASDAVVSLGLMGSQPKVVRFTAAGTITLLMITEETAGGVPQTANQPLVVGKLG